MLKSLVFEATYRSSRTADIGGKFRTRIQSRRSVYKAAACRGSDAFSARSNEDALSPRVFRKGTPRTPRVGNASANAKKPGYTPAAQCKPNKTSQNNRDAR